ncbi:uncharacterized protein LOC124127979 isoform X5 [Haliotis rufescens]|uniref:uncharacterized protein LOC124127979 isoform X5 n=1 Tax=Haliotis rufescens TaxID=6454 RepID=UPI00201FAA87|nr:uncharacterized protein LOC124127979 isoform X5 [Haliotis rufescens]
MSGSVAEKPSDLLTCGMCNNVYADPCTLRCDHTFCRKCVTGYIQTRPDAVQSKTIPCSFCRQDTKVPHPSRPVEEWAGQIKPSIIIQRLIDIHEPEHTRSDIADSQHCYVCWELGETTRAALWCPDCEVPLCDRCVRTHRASPDSREHKLSDLSWRHRMKRNRKLTCTDHTDEQVKFLFMDCSRLSCQSCSVLYHRKCESVVTLKKSKHELKVTSLSETHQLIHANIQAITETIVKNIKLKEQQLLDELDTITRTITDDIQAVLKHEEIEMQMYRQHCEFIDQALVSDCEMDLYDAYQAWESGAVELGDVRDTNTADTRRIDAIRFTPDTDNVQHILDDLQLGKIGVTYQTGTCRKSYPVMVDTTDGWMEEDVEEPDLHDVTVLLVNGIQTCVVTDAKNKFVKSFYTTNNQPCHSRLPLDDSPSGVTQLKENQVMVAVPDSSQIVTVEVIPDLVLLSTITTSKGYYSLAVLSPSSLAAGGSACVDILDMTGDVLRSVTTHNSETLFTYPAYMCVNNKGNILVSDWGKTSVTCVTSEGDVVWRYAPTGGKALSIPAGISTTKKGDIMVVDKDAETMIQLKETGEYVSDVITSQDGINQPLSLCIDKHDSVLVTCGREIKTFILT